MIFDPLRTKRRIQLVRRLRNRLKTMGITLSVDRVYFMLTMLNQLLGQKVKENGYLEISGMGAFYSRKSQKGRNVYGFYPEQGWSRMIEQRRNDLQKEEKENGITRTT